MDLSSIRNITSQTSISDIHKIISRPISVVSAITIQKRVLAEDESLPATAPIPTEQEEKDKKEDQLVDSQAKNPKVDFDIDYVTMLRQENDRLSYLVGLYQTKIDENLPNLKVEIDLSIFDYNSAYEATVFYSKEWFAESLLSDDGKSDFASYLLSVIKQYCGANTDTLTMISNGDADILSFIRVPRRSTS